MAAPAGAAILPGIILWKLGMIRRIVTLGLVVVAFWAGVQVGRMQGPTDSSQLAGEMTKTIEGAIR